MARIEDIEGVGPAMGEKLRAVGIRSTGALLKKAASAAGRKTLSEQTGIGSGPILEWVNRADLMRVRGVGSEYSDLLEAAGVDTVKELRNRNAENLAAKMIEINDEAIRKTKKSIVRRTPAISEVERWVNHAKTLDPAITY